MPDLDILIQSADYYDVELRELLDGERKSEKMNKEIEDTVLKVADYSNDEKKRFAKRMSIIFTVGLVFFTIYLGMEVMEIADTLMDGLVAGFTLGFAYGVMILGVLYTTGHLAKFRAFKLRLLKKMIKRN